MIGLANPTKFKDGLSTLINFGNYSIVAPLHLSIYKQVIDPIVELPGGAILDLYEANDLPSPRLMPVTIRVLIKSPTWNTTVAQWQAYQGTAGQLEARPVDDATLYTADCYLMTVNQVNQWGNGALIDLTFALTEDFS